MMRFEWTKLDVLPKYDWDRNEYYPMGSGANPFIVIKGQQTTPFNFTQWKELTRSDANSTCTSDAKPPSKAFVRPNAYEKGRANIIIFNWENKETVDVDLSGVLKGGDNFEVRDAQDWFGKPVVTGKYTGEKVSLPMKLTSIGKPVTKVEFKHTPPEFCVFVVKLVEAAPAAATATLDTRFVDDTRRP